MPDKDDDKKYRWAKKYANESRKARYQFYWEYKQLYSNDLILVDKFEQEYYLSKLECAKFEDKEREKRDTIREVREYYEKWKESDKKRQTLIKKIEENLESFK